MDNRRRERLCGFPGCPTKMAVCTRRKVWWMRKSWISLMLIYSNWLGEWNRWINRILGTHSECRWSKLCLITARNFRSKTFGWPSIDIDMQQRKAKVSLGMLSIEAFVSMVSYNECQQTSWYPPCLRWLRLLIKNAGQGQNNDWQMQGKKYEQLKAEMTIIQCQIKIPSANLCIHLVYLAVIHFAPQSRLPVCNT